MALFKKAPKSSPAAAPAVKPSITFDPFCGDERARFINAEVRAGRWQSDQEICEPITDWQMRNFYAGAAADVDEFPADWVDATSGSQFALLARGTHGVVAAWRIRGAGMAETVKGDAWNPFFERLGRAEEDLVAASELLAEDSSPWARLISCAMGLQLPIDEVLRRFHEATRRTPGDQHAHLAAIQATAKKWRGSHELMFDVARTADATLPPGSSARAAICSAHFERRLYMTGWEDRADDARGYYKDPDVISEIERAADRSVFAPEFTQSPYARLCLSHFTFALSMTGDAVKSNRLVALKLFDRLGVDGVPNGPWADGSLYLTIRSICERERDRQAADGEG